LEILRNELDHSSTTPAESGEVPESATAAVLTGDDTPAAVLATHWIPLSRHPEAVFAAYHGNAEGLTSTALHDAASDLRRLGAPPGLSKNGFNAWVNWALSQSATVRALDAYLSEPRRFGAIRAWLGSHSDILAGDSNATEAWQCLMRWLLHFCGDRYAVKTARYSEIFFRRR
jgi:hypothetical protein